MDEADRYHVQIIRALAPTLLEEPIQSDEEALAIWEGMDVTNRLLLVEAYERIDWSDHNAPQ